MTSAEQPSNSPKKLLTPTQIKHCKTIAGSDNDYSSRANALLALHDGVTQKEAATLTGLSIGQVRYWAARFRQLGMKAFPQTATEVASQKSTLEETVTEETSKKVKKKDSKKNKADKVNKKDKKSKKEKSAKKDKKKSKNKKKTKK